MKRLLFALVLLLPVLAQADVIRMKCGTVSADSCNDWYYTRGLNGAPHNPAGDNSLYYVGFTGAFQRRYAVTFYGVNTSGTVDSAFLKSVWVTTDSTIKPVCYLYGWKSESADTILDSTRWVAAYAARTTAVDSMYDSLWARNTTAFAWARTWNVKTIMQEYHDQAWWQLGDTVTFIEEPKAGTNGERSFKPLNYNGGGDSLIVFFTPGSPPIGGGGTGPRILLKK